MLKNIDFKAIAMRVGGVGAGAVAANAAYKILPTNMTARTKAFIVLAAGALLPAISGKGKSAGILQSVGDGMVAFGALALAKSTFSLDLNISGVEGTQYVEYAPAEVLDTVELAEAVNGIADIADALDSEENLAGPEDEDVIASDEYVAYADDYDE